ncbi:hypothetical protein AB0K74_29240 [Streptomyces sp. NPDC056159]|uniref:hypothetical protein n=1 Tax=unclassified Streptomyces TaxID=2593676 RepID=UPI00341E6A64
MTGIVRSIVPRDSEVRQIHQDRSDRLKEGFGDLVLPTAVNNYAVREVCRTTWHPAPAPGTSCLLEDSSVPAFETLLRFTASLHHPTPQRHRRFRRVASEALIPDPARFVPACASRPAPGLRQER